MCACVNAVCVGGAQGAERNRMREEDTDHTGSCEERIWRSLDFQGNGVIDGF